MQSPKYLLPVIVLSQFAGTSLWFAGNAIIHDIQPSANGGFANITSIVQFGFIAGTLLFSVLTIADRFRPSLVFFISSILAAFANLLLIWLAKDTEWLYLIRFITGFFLAGIYPVGMKIASDCFPERTGNALGYLVGALVLGTAFPHIIRSYLQGVQWETVIIFTSAIAASGGLLVLLFTPPYKKAAGAKPQLGTAFRIFRSKNLRASAFGYFGHMWELYTFWAFIPLILGFYTKLNNADLDISFWTFLIIATGAAGCVAGGILSTKYGSKKIAFYSLLISGICCVLSPFIFHLPLWAFLPFAIIWGTTVVSDSPQFSTLVAKSASSSNKGTALTIVTSLGFAITIVSMQLMEILIRSFEENSFLVLALGPVFGLVSLKNYLSGNDRTGKGIIAE